MLKSSLLHTWLEECTAQIHFFWREVHGVFQPFDVRLGQNGRHHRATLLRQ